MPHLLGCLKESLQVTRHEVAPAGGRGEGGRVSNECEGRGEAKEGKVQVVWKGKEGDHSDEWLVG
jgi:hypothetical protein